MNVNKKLLLWIFASIPWGMCGCTVKAVGDPNRPITINAHITVDIKGLKDSASTIEDFVSGEKSQEDLKKAGTIGGKK